MRIAGPKPAQQRGGVLIDRSGRYPAALQLPGVHAHIVRPAQHQLRVGAVGQAAFDGTSHHQVLIAPGVVGAGAVVDGEGAAEIALGEGGHRAVQAHRFERAVKRTQRVAHLFQQGGVFALGGAAGDDLIAVGVKAAQAGEENLPVALHHRVAGDEFGQLVQLVAPPECKRLAVG